MGDSSPMVIDNVKKSVKRKRADVSITSEQREAWIIVLRDEIGALNKYYNEKFSGNDLKISITIPEFVSHKINFFGSTSVSDIIQNRERLVIYQIP